MSLTDELLDPVYSKAVRVTQAAAHRIIRLEFDLEQAQREVRGKQLELTYQHQRLLEKDRAIERMVAELNALRERA